MSQSPPKVSVCVLSYNHGQFIGQCIESILNQTFQDFEVLITDDASTDDSVEVVKRYADDRIRFFRNPMNMGPSVGMNRNLAEAHGDYVSFMTSDDTFHPNKLETQVRLLDANPGIGVAFTPPVFIDRDGKVLTPDQVPAYGNLFHQPNRTRAEWLNFFFFRINCLCGPSAMARRSITEKVGDFDPRLIQLQDCDYWIRTCMLTDIHILNEPLVNYRMHAQQENLGFTQGATVRSFWEMSQILWRYTAIKDRGFFFEIFPEAAEIPNCASLPLDFLLARIAIGVKHPCWRTFGLELMHKVLEQDKTRIHLQEQGFSLPDYFKLAMEADSFNLRALSDTEQHLSRAFAAAEQLQGAITQLKQAHETAVAQINHTHSGQLADLDLQIRKLSSQITTLEQTVADRDWQAAKLKGTLGVVETALDVTALLSTSGRPFIELAYVVLLRRQPDLSGLHYFLGQLHAGMPKILVLEQIADSPEAQAAGISIPGLREAIGQHRSSWFRLAGRRLSNWIRRLRARTMRLNLETSVRERLRRSQDRQFVEVAYMALLGREADTAGLHYFLGQLRAGMPKTRVLQQIMSSPEASAFRMR